jgi:hypothetical protein
MEVKLTRFFDFLVSAVALLVFAGAWQPAWAATVDFERQVAPVLIRHCSQCHNASDLTGGLDLMSHAGSIAGGENEGAALVPGEPDESPLIYRIEGGDMPPEGKEKPVSAEDLAVLRDWVAAGAPWPKDRVLSPFEFTTDVRAGRDWWSLQPPVRPQVPTVDAQSQVKNSIDAFIIQKQQAKGLKMSPEADRATLIRRAMLDLHGLPPTPEEVDAFVADSRPDAYEQLIDRLLASPRYGERWARHWLDVVRFAESNGFETNQPRNNAWPYRDYVIAAFNEDKPYDQFIIEQIAGDQVGRDVGTGFLVAGPWDEVKSPDVELTRMQRLGELDDMASTTGGAFLGLTVGCAKCHDHKFDPISQVDYYALQAVFAGVTHGERPLRNGMNESQDQRRNELAAEIASAEYAKSALLSKLEPLAQPLAADATPAAGTPQRSGVHALGNVDRFAPVSARKFRFTILATNGGEPCIDELEVFSAEKTPRNVALASNGAIVTASGQYADGNSPIHRLAYVNDGEYGNSRSWISNEVGKGWIEIEFPKGEVIDRVSWARDRQGAFADRVAITYQIEVADEGGAWQVVASSADRKPFDSQAPRTLPAVEGLAPEEAAEYARWQARIAELNAELTKLLPQSAYVGNFVEPQEPTYRLHRGEPMQRREPVPPGTVTTVAPAVKIDPTLPEAKRRLALAEWIANPANPLTARVMVNRLWHYHFGQGLVKNPSDFGFGGGYPSHPELLDWLAVELMDNGWKLKHIHRLMMLSATYRQESIKRGEAAAIDGGDVYLWRYPPRRLEAEPIRDIILAVAGTLNPTAGGPGFDVFEPNSNYVKVYNPKQQFGPEEWRRMIYQKKPRMQHDATFGAFDCPDSAQPTAKRNRSTTPLQALNLFNGPFVVDQAFHFAERLKREAPDDVNKQIERAFRLAFGRMPDEAERTAAAQLVAAEGLPMLCRSILNANELLFIN